MKRLVNGAVALVVAGAAVLPLAWDSYYTLHAAKVLVFAVAIVGLALIMGLAGQVSLGHSAFFAVGAYVLTWCQRDGFLQGYEYLVALPLAFVCSAAVAGAVALVILRLEGLQLAIVTLGLAILTPSVIKRFDWATGGPQGLSLPQPNGVGDAIAAEDAWYLITVVTSVICFVLAWNLMRSRTGKSWSALRDHALASAGTGVDVARSKRAAFTLSGGFAGVAGALFALVNGYVSPEAFGLTTSVNLLAGLVVGGTSVLGALAGGAFVQLTPVWASELSTSVPGVLYGMALVVVMFVLPDGVTGLVRGANRRARAAWARGRTRTASATAAPSQS